MQIVEKTSRSWPISRPKTTAALLPTPGEHALEGKLVEGLAVAGTRTFGLRYRYTI